MRSLMMLTSLLSVFLVAVCVLLHYELMNLLARSFSLMRNHRLALLVTLFGLLAGHVVQIWIFGGGYWLTEHVLSAGTITPNTNDWFDYVYYSAMVYTTVGFGDLIPSGGLRMLTSAEALMGLSLITWSASFTFVQMQKLWRD